MANRKEIKQKIIHQAENDPRIVALMDYGSASEGRADQWSDLDLVLFITDEALASFTADWKMWAAQFGDLLLAYIGGVSHPWTVFQAEPLPLRVDFAFKKVSEWRVINTWPNAPLSVDHMILVDKSDQQFAPAVAQLVGQSLAPENIAAAFQQVCGDFWYYQLRNLAKIKRDAWWEARFDFNFILMGNLLALLRIEAQSVAHWRSRSAAASIEQDIDPGRLQQLNQLIPGPDSDDLLSAYRKSIALGVSVCQTIAQRENWPWPEKLAAQIKTLYATHN